MGLLEGRSGWDTWHRLQAEGLLLPYIPHILLLLLLPPPRLHMVHTSLLLPCPPSQVVHRSIYNAATSPGYYILETE